MRRFIPLSVLLLTLSGAFMMMAMLGCAGDPNTWESNFMERKGLIDPNAHLESKGSGQVSFIADQNGKVFLRDRDNVKQTYHWLIRQGQEFAVDADKKTVMVDEDVTRVDLNPNHTYEIFFRADKPEDTYGYQHQENKQPAQDKGPGDYANTDSSRPQ